MKQPKPYLLNVIDGLDAIASYRPSTEQEFMDDPKTQDAVLMRLQDIGENLSHVRDMFPNYWHEKSTDEWAKAIGLRNIISHGYTDVNLSIIWILISKNLPAFRQSVEKLL